SLAVNGSPSCHLTPWRSLKVSVVASSLHDHSLARSGTIVSSRFCAMCWSNITRLLNTAIIGPSETIVDSSWIDMLAGLSPWGILRMPPDFCAMLAPDAAASASTASIAARPHRFALPDDLIAGSSRATRYGQDPSLPGTRARTDIESGF